ncbi:MAG TPA: class I SAM-dependent methyltransferase [Anaerolineales bacterium]|nr:class I SAM-dependent methyltransferase [Anaerolineales bacterium]
MNKKITMNNNTVYEWLLNSTFTVSAREKSLESAKPHIITFVHSDIEALDLCCGTGFVSFWLEGLGAKVTGVDFAPYMISLAKEGAKPRNSSVQFVEADIFAYDFGKDCFDLITCFDSISDFPITDFAKLGGKIARALKPGGRFVVKYVDINYEYIQGDAAREGIYQESPERITYHIKGYLPEVGAVLNIIRNETRGDEYDRESYIYTSPIVRLAVGKALELEKHISLEINEFLDVFVKTQGADSIDWH